MAGSWGSAAAFARGVTIGDVGGDENKELSSSSLSSRSGNEYTHSGNCSAAKGRPANWFPDFSMQRDAEDAPVAGATSDAGALMGSFGNTGGEAGDHEQAVEGVSARSLAGTIFPSGQYRVQGPGDGEDAGDATDGVRTPSKASPQYVEQSSLSTDASECHVKLRGIPPGISPSKCTKVFLTGNAHAGRGDTSTDGRNIPTEVIYAVPPPMQALDHVSQGLPLYG